MDKNLENESTLNLEKSFLGGVFCITSKKDFSQLLHIISPKHFSTTMNKDIFSAMEKKYEEDKIKKVSEFDFELPKDTPKDTKNNNDNNENKDNSSLDSSLDEFTEIDNPDLLVFDYDNLVDTILKTNKKTDEFELRVYLDEMLSNNFFSFDLEDKAKLIVEKAKLREIESFGKKISKLTKEVSLTSEEVIEEIEKGIDELNHKKMPNTVVSVKDMALKQLALADKMNGNISNAGYKVGFSVIDDKLNGLSKSDLIIIAGRPSMGKTAFALNVLLKFCERNAKLNALFFSLEMPPDQLYFRLVAMESDIPISKLKYDNVYNDDEIALKYGEGLSRVATKNINIADTSSLTLFELKQIAKAQRDSKGLDLIVVDYLQLLTGENKRGQNKQQEVSEISRGLKQLARELNIPIIALSQLSRSVESRSDKRPMLSDLRESGAIEQDADIVMFLYRDEYYNPNSSDLGLAEIIVAKNRNGSIGTVKMQFEKECTKFTNYTDFSNMN